ncbi:imm11 family protein [Chengkuizengella axinellae]|uniref:Immunity MXAN-0049 protein domain-containing protein n=1 Tax=Chengkuizengella axinellae TaxID=3064388 RepID=A0ABT9J3F8_9BACL|nr:DUF1629 domain-containing protein [Chengkuizengella sp. 2205SS18-9]MDP5276147.1 hypothetical protein [Chengkuizengella sp. 2205SS18-9]
MDLRRDSNGFNYSDFYMIRNAMLKGAFELGKKEAIFTEDIIKGKKPEKPIIFQYYKGSRKKDIINGGLSVYLISNEFIKVLEENQFIGWDTFPMEAYDKEGKTIEGYYGLFITGQCGKIDTSLSKIENRPSPIGRMRPVYVGYCFDPDSWDGSDIFTAEGYNGIIISKKVKEALEKSDLKINNVEFKSLMDFEKRVPKDKM